MIVVRAAASLPNLLPSRLDFSQGTICQVCLPESGQVQAVTGLSPGRTWPSSANSLSYDNSPLVFFTLAMGEV